VNPPGEFTGADPVCPLGGLTGADPVLVLILLMVFVSQNQGLFVASCAPALYHPGNFP